jgi:3-deoxy-D-manno-octulosonate 8-phosphate phosphatase (KDO 8-P phosphatase)
MIEDRAADTKLLVLDVDGVLTDGRIRIDSHGEEIKVFCTKDGYGLKCLLRAGVEVAVITGRSSTALAHRMKDLGIKEVHQGVDDKGPLLDRLIRERGLKRENVCCMGDDIPDIPMLERAGLGVAVSDAAVEVRNFATLITKNRGGSGAVREVCELILMSKGLWPEKGN